MVYIRKRKSSNSLKARLLEFSESQRLNFRLMEIATFNNFEGCRVVRDLIANRHLWSGAVMDRQGYFGIDLIKLRDLGRHDMKEIEGIWNVDTLYILPKDNSKRCFSELDYMAGKWAADEKDWIDPAPANRMLGGGNSLPILRVWWD